MTSVESPESTTPLDGGTLVGSSRMTTQAPAISTFRISTRWRSPSGSHRARARRRREFRVHTTMRDANDRGFECLVLSDCTAATDHGNHVAALKMITMQGGVFGAHAPSARLLKALETPPSAVPA
jgi:hypothetical protein